MGDDLSLFDFNSAGATQAWHTVHDTVMGGRSNGTVTISDGRLLFSGEVSLANGGGFASARVQDARFDLSAFDGLALTCRGTERVFAMTVRTDIEVPAGSYRSPFTPGAELQRYCLSFDQFELRSFGRLVPGAPPLDRCNVRSIGFLIGGRQAGPFLLEVTSLTAFRRPDRTESR
jgi:monofunctional biosynthetic peptidoglycan transglycosylase